MGGGFGRLLRAEWTKLRSVRRWLLGMAAAVLLTLLISLLTAAGSGTDLNQHPEELGPLGPTGERVRDQLHLAHQPLAGDGSITARVTAQENSHESARAGLMIRESLVPGSRYAAVFVTPGHGVRFQANYRPDQDSAGSGAPRWLRLTRVGDTVTGYESPDGTSWREVGAVELDGLPAGALAGFFVNSPDEFEYERFVGGSSSSGERPTLGTATFDQVRVEPAAPGVRWQATDSSVGFVGPGEMEQDGDRFTLIGAGDLAVRPPDTDVAQMSLFGVILGQIAVAVVAVLFITSEFRRGMIRTSFAASPRRGRVLAAKAIVIGAASFLVGLVASVTAFLASQPLLRESGFGPPAYPVPSLTDWPVLRAVVGAAVLLALVAVLGLGLGAILRRGAGAIAVVVVLVLVPIFVEGGLPLTAAQWLVRSTPVAGQAILQSQPVAPHEQITAQGMASPLPGLGVVALYAAASLAIGYWRLRRRDA
ncbi:MAG: ABC transporter permease subunit [Natronosporangium sp.]